MNAPLSLHSQLRELIAHTPNSNIFPPEPWSPDDLEECAKIVGNFVAQTDEVIDDEDPWVDWLNRWFLSREKE